MEKRKNRWGGVVMGPVVVVMALLALWKNETRFDYHRAASETSPIVSPTDVVAAGRGISFTGAMDPWLTMSGEYVEAFSGYLMVDRSAEIYAWDRESNDDRVTWNLEWMSSLENNSRNSGISQVLSSRRFLPVEYWVGDLRVDPEHVQFVDPEEAIDPASLDVVRRNLTLEGGYLYLRKHEADNLGDERVHYSGVPVPETATYFGLLGDDGGLADKSQQRSGFIAGIINDTGVLHHIVAGDRDTALATMKAHLIRLKWIVRGGGTFAVVMGFYIFFATIFGVLLHIPIIGRLAAMGSFLVALVIGLPLALVVVVLSYLVAHPLLLAVVAGVAMVVCVVARQRGQSSQRTLKRSLDAQFGHALSAREMEDLEFVELAQLARSEDGISADEAKFLRRWARQHKWDGPRFDAMLARAMEERSAGTSTNEHHLLNLIHIALADGRVTAGEFKAIQRAARRLGYTGAAVREMIGRVRSSGGVGAAAMVPA